MPKPIFLFFQKSWLLWEMNMTTLTTPRTKPGREFGGFLVIGPSTSRLQTTSRLTSHPSLLHSHHPNYALAQWATCSSPSPDPLWLSDLHIPLSLSAWMPPPALHLDCFHRPCRYSPGTTSLLNAPKAGECLSLVFYLSHPWSCPTEMDCLLSTLWAFWGQKLLISLPSA